LEGSLLAQFHQRCAHAALILRRFFYAGDVGVTLEEFADTAAQDAGAVAVDYAHTGEAGEEGAVEILLQLLGGFIDGAADEVDFHAHVVGIGGSDGDVHAFLATCGG
jgi:hypothetical protein